jgi:hypothetical protein
MRPNRLMKELLASHPGAAEIIVPSPFRLLVFAGFREVDDCVVLRQLFRHEGLGGALDVHLDRTGYEASVNKIHLEDYLEPGMAREAPWLAHTAELCAEFLAERLRQHSKDRFAIIASVDGRYCAFRFHKVRHGESYLRDIETYNEAIFVVDV